MNNIPRGSIFVLIIVLLIILVSAAAPVWDDEINLGNESNKTSYFLEDTVFSYNFTDNVTDANGDPLVFTLSTGGASEPIVWSENTSKTRDFFEWIFWEDTLDRVSNSSTGILSFNVTLTNQTGKFNISVDASDGFESAGARKFFFIVNATNDAPNFTNIRSEYNLTQDSVFTEYLNATDEEGQYPLVFNITFFGNCTHASWSGRVAGENCTIIDAVNLTNISAIMNFTPEFNDVGTYWANISVMDFGNSSDYGCPHEYCTPDTYNLNQTTVYSSVVVFNVFSRLDINISDCQNKIFEENVSGLCDINITTRGDNDSLNISSTALLRNYTGGVYNRSWFFSNVSSSSENFFKTITINFTPQKTEIGNWTINFTVQDFDSGENSSKEIYVYVNKNISLDDVPDLISISDVNTSIDLLTTISLEVYDDDLLIPHKNFNYGGYNETISFNLTVLNASDLSQELSISNFDVDILSMPVLSGGVPTNKTTAQIQFTPTLSDAGNYTINLTVTDFNNATDTETFDLLIVSNQFPYWNDSLVTIYSVVEGGNFYLNLSESAIDPEDDPLTFSNFSETSFPGFTFNTATGEINISNISDEDVGQHLINITVSDGYLTNTTTFNFTVNNTEESPFLEIPITVSGASGPPIIQNINTTEDINSTIILFIQDDDFKVPANQKIFYNESLTINTTIQGPNVNLFNFSFDQFLTTNRTKYIANFVPVKSDVGIYNVSINITDISGASDFISFNLTVNATEHNPSLVSKADLASSVEESILVDFNATDLEDGNDSNGALVFNISFVSGSDFIGGDETIFNTTSGILNFNFSSGSYGGVYTLNVSVKDTTDRYDWYLWNLSVYDYPVFLYPGSSIAFSTVENVTSIFNFSVNHTVGDNLTYSLYVDDVLRNSTSSYGDGTNVSMQFTPNYTEETTCTGDVTLVIQVSNSKLSNISSWNMEINHSNYPLRFEGSIGGNAELVSGGGSATVDLSAYFKDFDADDSCINQSIGFVTTFINGTELGVSVVNWTNSTVSPSVTYTHPSSSGTVTGNYSLTAYEYNISNGVLIDTLEANNYSVQLSITTNVVVAPSSGGGGGGRRTENKPVSLKIIVPEPVSSKRKDRLLLPISLVNSGEVDLNNIYLKASISKDGLLREDLLASFDNSVIDKLGAGEEENLTLIVDANTEEYGLYEITLNATVENPEYNDWAKIFINVEETEAILERILFTEEFVSGNPECVELTELVNDAKDLLDIGEVDASFDKLDEAMESCRRLIEQPAIVRVKNQFEKYLFNYIWLISLIFFLLGFLYYSYRRRKLRGGLRELKEGFDSNSKERFNNKKSLMEV